MRIRNIFLSTATLLLTAATLIGISACDDGTVDGADSVTDSIFEAEKVTSDAETELNYDGILFSDYVSNIKYKELNIILENGEISEEEALWNEILSKAQIISYPEDKVDYYFNQTKGYYMYLVNNDEEDYKLLLKNRGTDEQKMREEARALVKKDIVYYYIVDCEGIAVTEAEKSELFEKYVDKYSTDYHYDRDYIKANMTNEIYASMLYDKTMEYLKQNNNFKASDKTQDTEKTENTEKNS